MDFSDFFRQSKSICAFDPTGDYIANVAGNRLVVRSAETLQVANVIETVDAISAIEFSPDGAYIFLASFDLGALQVWEVLGTAPVAKIDEGVAGIVRAMWDPLSARSLMTWSAFGLRISVWNLCDGSLTYIQQPKFADRGTAFRADHRYCAVLDRSGGKDSVCVYDCAEWVLVKRFNVETVDADNLAWSPDGRRIAVWDSLLDYKVLIYSPEGSLLYTYVAHEYGLGVRSAVWSPTSQFLAVGSYDQKLRLLNHYSFTPLAEWEHGASMTLTPKSIAAVFREPGCLGLPTGDEPEWPTSAMVSGATQPKTRFEIVLPPAPSHRNIQLKFPFVKMEVNKSANEVGISMIRWSVDGRYLALKNENTPTLLHIYSMKLVRLIAVLQFSESIKQAEWLKGEQSKHTLVACTGSSSLYFWDSSRTVVRDPMARDAHDVEVVPFSKEDDDMGLEPTGIVEAVSVPGGALRLTGFRWSPDEKRVIVMGGDAGQRVDRFCVGFTVDMEAMQS
ncbi:WD40-repeat-containing domain protein [Blastocladiella britannica]|nr:WD40-repeat-containing domain protein [Blastocladiella britannica]